MFLNYICEIFNFRRVADETELESVVMPTAHLINFVLGVSLRFSF